ncbi:MAG: hypothetical protein IJ520_08825, partial [Synergistaceae bacterium]|nr:hypothetical protein [Synergistaceae bacterium]
IEVLDTSALTKLKSLSFANNEISAIDVSNSPALYSLSAWKNRLTALDITKNPNLTFVAFAFNQVRTLDLSNNKKLEHLSCERNQFAALDLGGCTSLVSKGSDGWDYSVFEQQLVNPLTITRQTGEDISYPFVFNFSNYMQSSQFKNISADSVQGYDSDNQEIETVYSNGTARFAAEPAKVRYQYQTGFDNRYLNVTVSNSGEDYMTLSLNNHVYRIIFNLKDWNSAKEYCESLGGHLLTVTNEAEMQLILDMLTEADRITGSGIHYSEYWIGGFTGQENDNKKYTWPDNGDISPDTKLLLEYSEEYGIGTGDTETENSYYSPSEKFDFICEWEPVAANFAQYSDEYKRWLASRDENTFGEIPDAVDYSNLEGNPPDTTYEAEPPAKYDPRDLDFDFRVSDQGSYGTCWSFASIGALEASYIAQGFGSSAPDLSELHQAWFVFKDPRPSYAKPLFDTSETPLNQGGNNAMSIAFLSRIGPAAEADLPYAQAKNVESLTKGKYPENYSHPIRLKAAYELGAVNAANRTEVKQLIMKYGAIRIGYKTDSSAYRNDSYYAVGNGDGGHAVDIVGWDDNYSRLNFKNNPGKNGAWLCKNSWGTSWADKGFFWMSYEQYIYTSAVYIAANDEVQKVYGHDATAVIESLPHNWFTSIFRADSDENLNEVAFHTRNNNTSYEVYVNKYGANEPANPGVV